MRMVERALEFAAQAHEGQYRKQTKTPYVSHPYAVGLLLAEAGCEESIVAAGILHDTIEDTPVTFEDLQDLFGEDVARLVAGASEPDKTKTWQARKEHTIEYLKSAPRDVCMVVCADKLHNLRSIRRDLQEVGVSAWSRFNVKDPAKHAWYYTSIVRSMSKTLAGFALFETFRTEVFEVFPGTD